jgi:hypothetical protein
VLAENLAGLLSKAPITDVAVLSIKLRDLIPISLIELANVSLG